MEMELFGGFANKVRNTMLQMAASDRTEATIPGNAGLRLLREDSIELPERQSAEGGVLSVHEHEDLKYHVCAFENLASRANAGIFDQQLESAAELDEETGLGGAVEFKSASVARPHMLHMLRCVRGPPVSTQKEFRSYLISAKHPPVLFKLTKRVGVTLLIGGFFQNPCVGQRIFFNKVNAVLEMSEPISLNVSVVKLAPTQADALARMMLTGGVDLSSSAMAAGVSAAACSSVGFSGSRRIASAR